MDADTKVKELEEEFKILKAEIRNVLLDIREVILENSNPLGDDHQGAFIRMDLNTTAQTMAASAASKAVADATNTSEQRETPAVEGPAIAPASSSGAPEVEATPEPVATAHEPEIEGQAAEPVPPAATEQATEEPTPTVVKKSFPEEPMPEPVDSAVSEIPEMYRAVPSFDSVPRLSEWLGTALATVGPRELERVIAVERLWGNLPPHILRALTYVQDLLKDTEDIEPPWLRIMRDLDRLSVI